MMLASQLQAGVPFLHITWVKTCTVISRHGEWAWVTDGDQPWTEDVTELARCAAEITVPDPKVQVQVPQSTVERADSDLVVDDMYAEMMGWQ